MKTLNIYINEHIIKGHLKKQHYLVYKSKIDSSKDLHVVILTDDIQIKEFIKKFKPVHPNVFTSGTNIGVIIYPVGDDINYIPLYKGIWDERVKWFELVDYIKSLDDINSEYFKKHGWY